MNMASRLTGIVPSSISEPRLPPGKTSFLPSSESVAAMDPKQMKPREKPPEAPVQDTASLSRLIPSQNGRGSWFLPPYSGLEARNAYSSRTGASGRSCAPLVASRDDPASSALLRSLRAVTNAQWDGRPAKLTWGITPHGIRRGKHSLVGSCIPVHNEERSARKTERLGCLSSMALGGCYRSSRYCGVGQGGGATDGRGLSTSKRLRSRRLL